MKTALSFAGLALLCAGGLWSEAAPKDFQARIDDYMKLRKRATEGLPALKPKAEAVEIERNKKAIAEAIRSARTGTKQGNIFSPGTSTAILALVRSEMKGAAGKDSKKTAKDGNPTEEPGPVPVRVEVNAAYPDSAPSSSVSPGLLQRLPKLPKELDYRFVGRHLVLRDAEALIILDFVPNAMP